MQCIVLVQKKSSNAVSASDEKSDLALVRVFRVDSGRELCKPIRYSTLMLLPLGWVELGLRGVSRGGNRLWLWLKRCLVRSRDSSWGAARQSP